MPHILPGLKTLDVVKLVISINKNAKIIRLTTYLGLSLHIRLSNYLHYITTQKSNNKLFK